MYFQSMTFQEIFWVGGDGVGVGKGGSVSPGKHYCFNSRMERANLSRQGIFRVISVLQPRERGRKGIGHPVC